MKTLFNQNQSEYKQNPIAKKTEISALKCLKLKFILNSNNFLFFIIYCMEPNFWNRISVIFQVRSAKTIKISDGNLLKRLGCICGVIGIFLLVRTLVSPPDVVVKRTADDLKAFLCKTDWWDYTFTSSKYFFKYLYIFCTITLRIPLLCFSVV